MKRPDGPLLVYGPRSTDYDFGPGHPLTPRRFGPGIDLLRAVGAEPSLAPEPADDADLLRCHSARYLAAVRRLSADPEGAPEAGIGYGGDDPPFAGMHEAGATVGGGSLRAIEAILRGEVDHAFHPGGGLHHAARDRASGFCIYNDVALAIARAREAGLRVLYVDLDVHHGDGVQALHADDPGVLTVSFHESGRYLFPGTGSVRELGTGAAAGTVVNVPLEPGCGEAGWIGAVRSLVPLVAAAFQPDLVVSQHGADSHALDPLAHLRVTTTAMGEAARIVDAVAHRWAGGRWLSTGGGGYDAYRVVPRAWALTWLAGAHREVPPATPVAWRERWAAEAVRYRQAPLPDEFTDPPGGGLAVAAEGADADEAAADEAAARVAGLVRRLAVPAFVRVAAERGWWDPLAPPRPAGREVADRLLALPAADAAAALQAARDAGATVVTTEEAGVVVGAAVAVAHAGRPGRELVAVGVAPSHRRRGIGRELLRRVADGPRPLVATVTVAERDVIEPIDRERRSTIARALFERAGFRVRRAGGDLGLADPEALEAELV